MPANDDRPPTRPIGAARDEGPPTRADVERDADPGARVGQRFGRFEILDVLGSGGMGTVFEARDRLLDRAVALKLLHPDAVARAERRVLREAQALAKLSHPNVVQVFEAGTIDDRPFIAMELVRGQTLAAWQAAAHAWREVVAVYLQAGRGLAAAHAQGLVHRDFKPSNCILDAQGRVRVLDFGLARAIDPAVVTEARASRASFDGAPSTGAHLDGRSQERGAPGTLGYMPLEQLWGQPLDAKSDQFSFCVSLFEGVYGRRPFSGESVDALVVAMLDGAIDWPPGPTKVPTRLRRLLERGLQARPGARWPGMDDLLRELELLVRPRRRGGAWAAGGGALALTVALGGALWLGRAPACEDARRALDDAWGPARRARVTEVIEGAGVDVSPEVVPQLDAYAQRWIALQGAACEAERGELVDASTAATQRRCLTEARAMLGNLVTLLSEADDRRLALASRWITELPDLTLCEDVARFASTWPLPEDPALTDQVRAIRLRRNMVEASHAAGERAAALAELDAVIADAEGLGYPPLVAELEVLRGNLWIEHGRYEDAERELERAYARAVEHEHPHVALWAANALAYLVGDLREHHDVGFKWGLTAEALARQPWSTPPTLASTMEMLGNLLYEQGRFAAAHQRFQGALELREQGNPDDPMTPLTATNMALVLYEQGRYEEALPLVHEVLERRRVELLPEDATLAFPLMLLGSTLHRLGRHPEALACFHEVLDLREQALGPAHPGLVNVYDELGRLWLDMGEPARALHAYQQALSIGTAALDPTHSHLADAWLGLGQVLWAQGQLDAAARHVARGLKMLEQTVGPRHVNVGEAAAALGRIELSRGDRQAAREHLELAVEILAHAEGPPTELAAAWFALAQVLWSSPGEHDAARVLAERALGANVTAGDPAREQAAEVRAWLAARGAG